MKLAGTALVAATVAAVLSAAEPVRIQLAGYILGLTVENRDGQRLGKAKDFVVDLHDGAVPYVVIASGGFAGLNSRFKIVPTPALSTATVKKGTAALGITKVRWETAPEFYKSNLSTFGQPDQMQQIYGYYGLHPSSLMKPDLLMSRDIVGRRVFGLQEENLGVVSNLLVDLSGQKPAMAIVSTHGVIRRRENFAVPLHSLTLAPRGRVLLGLSRRQIESAPRFDPAKWQAASTNATPGVYRFEVN